MLRLSLVWVVLVAVAVTLWVGLPAQATIFSLQCPKDCPVTAGAGRFLQSDVTFDDLSLDFSWTARFEAANGNLPDGMWIVVSEGRDRNPNEEGLAILYGDASGTVSAYVYDPANAPDSFRDPGGFIATFANALTFTDLPGGERELRLALNVSGINGFRSDSDWRGIAFDQEIGIWSLASTGTEIDFDKDGRIGDFRDVGRSPYDLRNRETIVVPESSSMLLLAAGLLALSRRQRSC